MPKEVKSAEEVKHLIEACFWSNGDVPRIVVIRHPTAGWDVTVASSRVSALFEAKTASTFVKSRYELA